MKNLLREISDIAAVQSVFLLSEHGDVLFESDHGRIFSSDDGFMKLTKTIGSIGTARSAYFLFENGSLHLSKTEIGYLLIGMETSASRARIRDGCTWVRDKLANPESRKRILLQALASSRQILKPQIVKALVPYGDDEVAKRLVSLLAAEEGFSSEIHDRLMLHICETLGHCSETGLSALRELVKRKGYLGEAILSAAQRAIKRVENNSAPQVEPVRPKTPLPSPVAPIKKHQVRDQGNQQKNTLPISGDRPDEQGVRELLAQGEKEKAKLLVKQMIVTTAKEKRFSDAENLREWLIEIDNTALGDIIQAAEIIEKEKSISINKAHLAVWSFMSEFLDADEFATLYHCLEHSTAARGKMLVRQGTHQLLLYLINSGRVELIFDQDGKDVPFKTAGSGEILGADSFFESSVWTFGVRSLGAEISTLSYERLQQCQKNYPSLESNLSDFCARFKIPHESIKKMGRERRVFERVRISGKVAIAFLDREGRDTGMGAKGDLVDISASGASFFLRISQKKTARLFYGRRVRVTLSSAFVSTFSITGIVLAVRSQPVVGNEYSVHIRFSRVLEEAELQNLLASGTMPS